eukprot:TRINITY_DN4704_c0_g1_i1.p1 TRINITY_DN4704_c0_g1~~TRINITY_DN4704_c0_g1_i1.p1  ORF type:complete len:307 (-),score=94.68 TRINITY_DN4704_c0_g1_i1:104-991(-)
MEDIIYASLLCVQKASKIIHDIYQNHSMNIGLKGEKDYVTQADTTVETMIKSTFMKYFPDIFVVGEENETFDSKSVLNIDFNFNFLKSLDFPEFDQKKLVMFIDPLDGTREYVEHHIEKVSTLVGFTYENRPVAGIIHSPFAAFDDKLGKTIWCCKGVGIFGFEPKFDDKLSILFSSHINSEQNQCIKHLCKELKPNYRAMHGAAGYKFRLLFNGVGSLYIYMSNRCSQWDTCAGEAFLTILGGKITDCDGKPLDYSKDSLTHKHKHGFIASSPLMDEEMHARVVELVQPFVSQL